MKNCPLCEEFNIEDFTKKHDLKKYFPNTRVLFKNKHFCIYPALGGFVKGYILFSTIEHYLSLCECSNEFIGEIEIAIGKLRAVFKEKMGSDCVFFEHGTVSDHSLSPASIYHFHLHFLPVNQPMWELLNEKYNFEYLKIDSFKDVKRIVNEQKITSYILFGDVDNNKYLINCGLGKYPSQFLRRVMYDHYFGEAKNEEWNWKTHPYYEVMLETFNAMKGLSIE